MLHKRLWIALVICAWLITIVMSVEKSRQATAAGVVDPSCTSSLPCIEYDNNSTGPGIRALSVAGNGIGGSTKYASTPVGGKAGVFGSDTGTGRSNSGVHGLSVNGTGVSGLSATGAGVNGASNYIGVAGSSTGYIGVFGTGPTYGVAGSSVSGVGVYGLSTTGAANGIGVLGLSTNFVGVSAVGGSRAGTNDFPALSIVDVGNNDLIDGCSDTSVTQTPCDSNHSVFSVNQIGQIHSDIIYAVALHTDSDTQILGGLAVGNLRVPNPGFIDITGQYEIKGNCALGCSAATAVVPGHAVTTYAPMVSQPTIEDFGEAQLVNGETFVRLDPKFANVVDQRANYLVFITPEGDANVLYVTQKTPEGFTVRESHAGRSTLMFSYRIVAKPFGSHEARLPMVELPKLRVSLPTQARRFHPKP